MVGVGPDVLANRYFIRKEYLDIFNVLDNFGFNVSTDAFYSRVKYTQSLSRIKTGLGNQQSSVVISIGTPHFLKARSNHRCAMVLLTLFNCSKSTGTKVLITQ